MKKILCILAAAFILSVPAKAQANHVYVGASDAIIYSVAFAIGSIFGSAFSAPLAGETVSLNHYGCYSLSYERDLGTSGVAIGGTLSGIPTRYQIKKNESGEIVTDDKGAVYIAMADFRFSYLRRKNFNLFSQAMAGASYSGDMSGSSSSSSSESDSSDVNLAFQINPIGMRFGNERIGGYLAIGIGNLGIFSAGLSFGF